MGRFNSKQKGAEFERDVCKRLSLWVTGGRREDAFWRSAMSGGRATVGRRAGKTLDRHAGDISATSPEGHALTDFWYVECKAYKDLGLEGAMLEGQGPLAKFWRKTCEEATAHGKLPMLIAKQNMRRIMLVTPVASFLNPYGVHPLRHTAAIARLYVLRADVFCFDTVTSQPFPEMGRETDFKFLAPGELARILNGRAKVKRAKIKKGKL